MRAHTSRGGETHQLWSQLQRDASCRRSCAPSTPPVVADSYDERDEVWYESCALSSDGSTQPLTAESEDHSRHWSRKVPFILVRVVFSGAFVSRMRVRPSSGGKGAVWSDWNVLSCEGSFVCLPSDRLI